MIRSTFAGFSNALSAIQANQKRMDIIGQNLANMNTAGYTRQQLEVSSLNYIGPVSHLTNGSDVTVGFGVSMNRVSQIRDPYLDVQYRSQINRSAYTGAMQTALDSLSTFLDESNIDGLHTALLDIQTTLTNMQDPAKVNDPAIEGELRNRMRTLTDLLNSAARDINTAQENELARLDGAGSSENGAVNRVNDLLQQIGDLNIQIKNNQVIGQSSLELQDNRNLLLDELASYIPIEISYKKDAEHTGFEYDAKGNIIGKKEWPDDLIVKMAYTDSSGVTQKMTLVNGSEGGKGNNYGRLEMDFNSSPDGQAAAGDPDAEIDPLTAAIKFIAAASSGDPDTLASAWDSQFKDGSIQASLDMLGKKGTGDPISGSATTDDIRGYQYYMEQLNTLAKSFTDSMNAINKTGIQGDPPANTDPYELLGYDPDNAALTIGITADWISGAVHIGKSGESSTDNVINLLKNMTDKQSSLGNKTFASFIGNVSTILANDSSSNQNALKTNVTVLNSIQDSRDSISGVSLDEEAANLMAYTSAYNAASRLMTALDEALNTLINNTGLVGR